MTTNKNENGGSDTDNIMAQKETEEGHFCWDKSDNKVIETLKEAEKDNGKETWHQVDTASKGKAVTGKLGANNATPTKQSRTTVTVQTNTATATKTVAELMKEQGEGYVEDES
eukprot:12828506-Ditylum_brightwellii.AAC.1